MRPCETVNTTAHEVHSTSELNRFNIVIIVWNRTRTKVGGTVCNPCIKKLLHSSLSVKAVTLIFISGRDLAISSTHEGKTGNINGKTENCNYLLRVNKYKLYSVKQKDP